MHPSYRQDAPVYAYVLHDNCYLNVSNRCNLHCTFCPRLDGCWQVQGYDLRLLRRQEPGAADLLAAVGNPAAFTEIVFCGLGEPTLRLDTLLTVGRELRQRGARVRLNTNGLANQYHGRDVTPELGTAVDALSISLNAQDEATYDRHCRPKQPGAYPALLAFIERARQHIADITLTAIDGLEGVDLVACARIATDFGVNFRARPLDVIG
jgi:TatD DNase family protein